MSLPNDPVLLLSYLNTQLRDYYPSFEEFCKANDEDQQLLLDKLAAIEYQYSPDCNQFV